MKGNASCHIPNDKYRAGWDFISAKADAIYKYCDSTLVNYYDCSRCGKEFIVDDGEAPKYCSECGVKFRPGNNGKTG